MLTTIKCNVSSTFVMFLMLTFVCVHLLWMEIKIVVLNQACTFERIFKDPSIWNECKAASEQFLKICLLPEILGNWYTRSTVTTSDDSTTDSAATTSTLLDNSTTLDGVDAGFTDQLTYCYCHHLEEGTMIACDNPDCPIEWFTTN